MAGSGWYYDVVTVEEWLAQSFPRLMTAADLGLDQPFANLFFCYDCDSHVTRADISRCTVCEGTLWR